MISLKISPSRALLYKAGGSFFIFRQRIFLCISAEPGTRSTICTSSFPVLSSAQKSLAAAADLFPHRCAFRGSRYTRYIFAPKGFLREKISRCRFIKRRTEDAGSSCPNKLPFIGELVSTCRDWPPGQSFRKFDLDEQIFCPFLRKSRKTAASR